MKRLVLAILAVLLLGVAANAQTFRGAINGTVSDPSGAVVPNAQVKAKEKSTGIDHSTVTTTDGQFAFQDIAVGMYAVTVTATGFPALTVDNVPVTQGAIYTLPVKLTLSQQTTTVEVSAAALTLASDLFEFSWRYQLLALVTLAPAGALGIATIIRSIRTRQRSG